jgi:hypothetical protein
MRKPIPATGWRGGLEAFSTGLMFVLKPLQFIGNYLFLGLAYVFGVGLSSLLYKLGPRRKARRAPLPETYWRELPPASRDQDAWQRPF